MGILVRLLLSLGGAIVGAAAFAAVFALIFAGGVLALLKAEVVSKAYFKAYCGDEGQYFFLGVAVVASLAGIRGAIAGYRTGLRMGRDICCAPEPEQNSRVEVTVSGKSKS
jgi:hypothetical protein